MGTPAGPRYQTAFFDIDGTLCDPGEGITDAVAYALRKMGLQARDDDALRRFVGPPLEHSFRDFCGLGPAEVTQAVSHYREHYGSQGLAKYRAYPDAGELLVTLDRAGVGVAVVTAKIHSFAEEALRITGLSQYGVPVFGRDAQEVVTKAVTLAGAVRVTGADPAAAVMVGDREHDVVAAVESGIDSIGVLHGFGSRTELRRAGATYVVDSLTGVGPVILPPPATGSAAPERLSP